MVILRQPLGSVMPRFCLLTFVLLVSCRVGFAQHEGHKMPPPKSAAPGQPSPSPSPSPSPTPMEGEMPASHRHPPPPATMPGMKAPDSNMEMNDANQPMEMGPLLMMQGNQMFIRVGNSSTNL